jgi:hypothetical protein
MTPVLNRFVIVPSSDLRAFSEQMSSVHYYIALDGGFGMYD